jgi:hypothetical protein
MPCIFNGIDVGGLEAENERTGFFIGSIKAGAMAARSQGSELVII